MQKRIQYLDIIKVISIFLVVFCHFVLLAETIPANIFMVACWSGVPMFFMVNGALLFTRPLNLSKHIRKTLLIYIVLVLWKLIYLFSIGALCQVPVANFGKNQILLYLFAFGSLEGIGTDVYKRQGFFCWAAWPWIRIRYIRRTWISSYCLFREGRIWRKLQWRLWMN